MSKVKLSLALAVLGSACSPLRHYELASSGPGDTSAGDVTHASDSQARVVTPKRASEHAAGRDSVTQTAYYDHHGPALLPDSSVTPGKVNPAVTKAIACSTKWGKDERPSLPKARIYAEYGISPGRGVCQLVAHKGKNGKVVKKGCEIDHLISRELGGADDPENLWPQPYLTPDQPGAYQKDALENWLHKQVCAGKISLADAQKQIATDWYAVYLEMQKEAK